MQKTRQSLAKFDAPVFSYFQALYLSFYSKWLYIDVAKRWKGFGFLYILLLVAILIIPITIKWSIMYNEIFTTQIIEPISLVPKLVIQNGNLIFDKPMPFFIKNKHNEIAAIIDTTGAITTIDSKKYPQVFTLITKNNIQFRTPNLNPYMHGIEEKNSIHTFDKNDNEIFDAQVWAKQGGIQTIKHLTTLLVYPLLYALFVPLVMIFVFLMALIGQVFSTIFFDFKTNLKQACRLMAVTATPVLLIFFMLISFKPDLGGFGFPLVALWAGYFSFAIVFLKKESKKMVIR